MVTICPIFIKVLITSVAFTAILRASSATEIVSGTLTSRTMGSVGITVATGAWRSLFFFERCQLPSSSVPPSIAPRVFIARCERVSSPHPMSEPDRSFRLRPLKPPFLEDSLRSSVEEEDVLRSGFFSSFAGAAGRFTGVAFAFKTTFGRASI